ncbi:MAG TPA: 50S ribosomal protein L21, partial [Bacteroidetes bacterium]|nr:50S ribosomal protein L21 [Bacteroidota bacterium]
MYAIVDIAGQQFKVEKGKKIFVHLLDEEEGNNVDFDKVLLIDNDGKIIIGEPHIAGAYIEGKVLEHTKGDKVIVFKKKRRKGYKVKKGHRQQFSQIEILSINENGFEKKPDKAAAVKADKAKTTAPKAEDKTAEAAAKKPAAKTTAPKDSAAKKSTAEKEPAAEKETKTTAA